jgi:YidC/Oxa1 family membrane protein insertase
MNIRKMVLYAALGIVLFLLWTEWTKEFSPKPAAQAVQQTATSASQTVNNVPSNNNAQIIPATATQQQIPGTSTTPADRIINVHTDVLNVAIDTMGGNVVRAALPKYPATIKNPNEPIQILSDDPTKLYEAQSGILGVNNNKPLAFKVSQINYGLGEGQNNLVVNLTWQDNTGLLITKTFTFTRGSYAIAIDYKIANKSAKTWSGQFYTQIQRHKIAESGGMFALHTFTGAAISSAAKPYEKLSYSEMNKTNLNRSIQGGWVAMQQRYFLSAWVPEQNETYNYYSHTADEQVYTIGLTNPIAIVPGKTLNIGSKLYVGPQIAANLKTVAKHLDLTVDYGWLWFISVALFWLLDKIYKFIGNWGWSIVILTIFIKVALYKFSESSYVSMAKMRALMPKIKELKARYAGDKQKLSQATMELYKREKVNPIGGCLPQLIQIPVFLALYYVLAGAVELRQAPFIFWIHDLSARDPYFILPILMGASMLLMTKMNPTQMDPTQAKMMLFMPIIFTVLFATFPAGLVLYWLVNNLLSIAQQWYIMRRYEKKHPA